MLFDDIARLAERNRRVKSELDEALKLLEQVARGEKGKDEVTNWLIAKATRTIKGEV